MVLRKMILIEDCFIKEGNGWGIIVMIIYGGSVFNNLMIMYLGL